MCPSILLIDSKITEYHDYTHPYLQHCKNKIDILSWETCDSLLVSLNLLTVFFYNHTKQHIVRSVHSQHHRIPNNHAITQRHPFKITKFIDKSSKIWKAVLTISHSHDSYHFKAAMSPNFASSPSHTPFWMPSLVTMHHRHIFLHADWPSWHCNSLYIHHNHLIF